jgi:hypothetical protein
MKIFISEKTKLKLINMIKDQKVGFISIRKFDPKKDPVTNVVDKIKLSEAHRIKHKTGKPYKYYVSKDILKELNKQGIEGGILPLLPLIFGGIGALSALAGGAASVAKAVNDKSAKDLELQEQRRYHNELLAKSEEPVKEGGCLEQEGGEISASPCQGKVYKDFVKSLKNVEKPDKKLVKNILNGLQSIVKIEKSGNGLYISSM